MVVRGEIFTDSLNSDVYLSSTSGYEHLFMSLCNLLLYLSVMPLFGVGSAFFTYYQLRHMTIMIVNSGICRSEFGLIKVLSHHLCGRTVENHKNL
jgi:hypothetical protein